MVLLLTMLVGAGSSAWAADKSLTFVQESSNSGTLSGEVPTGVTATFTNTYTTNKFQLTKNNSMTLTLSGWAETTTIKGVTLTVSNNKSSGNGTATVKIGENTLGTLSITKLGNTYQDKGLEITPTLATADLVINISATENSVYCNKFVITYEEDSSMPTIAAPTFSVESGSVAYGTNVTISNYDNNYYYFYTTDGTAPSCDENLDPTGTSTSYSSGITITNDVTVKVIAVDIDGNKSAVTSASYTIVRPTAPVLSPDAGAVEANTTVTISNPNDDYLYFYTEDGTTPTVSDLEATGTTKVFPDDGVTINETKTLTVVAVDENGLMSDLTTATYTVKAFVHGYTIDFEAGDTGSYLDWVFVNIQIDSETIIAHGGNNHGVNKNNSGNATTTCSITTKDIIANPHIIKFYISKHSNNTTSSSWNVEVSTDGTNWTQVGDAQSATSMSKGNWTEVTRDLSEYNNVYVRIRYGSSNAVRAIDDISITEKTPKNVAAPTFSVAAGTYEEAQSVELTCKTEGATIYYTTDGSSPTNESTEYTTAITVDQTMTIKAIAYKNSEASDVATATYTINLPLKTIAKVKELTSGDSFKLNLSGAQVVYFDGGKNLYVRDASGAILFYNSNNFSTALQTGDILSGIVSGKYSPYNGLPEVINSDITGITATGNEVVVAKTIAGTTEALAANLCDLVKIEDTEITLSDSKYYVGDNSDIQLHDGLHINLTFNEGNADVQGIATVYNNTYELFPRFESDIVYLSNAVPVEIGAAGMATFSSDKALDFTAVDAIAAYYATVTDGKVTFTRIKKVPANTGLLIRNAQGEDKGAVAAINVPVLADATTAESTTGNALVAVAVEIAKLPSTSDGYNNYILNKHSQYGLGFFKAADKKVAAGKAYLRIATSEAPARDFIGFIADDTTGLYQIENGTVDIVGEVYDLQGRRVTKPAKGLYIMNGKKMLVK